jgi:hypothetical protein
LPDEIDIYFENLDFERVEVNPDVPLYFNQQMKVIVAIVADAHERDILRTEEGKLAPIDVVIGVPDDNMLHRILLKISGS